jgi:hypothetical protein
MRRFEHVIIADLSGNLDLELIGCGARTASVSGASSILAVTQPGGEMLQAFASVVRAIYERERAAEPRYRVLPNSGFGTLLSITDDSPDDLLLVRYSGLDSRSRRAARRLLCAAPTSVLLLPEAATATEMIQIDAPEVSSVGSALRRDGTEKVLSANVPLLSLRRTRRSTPGLRQILREIFAHPEPTFN